jgi:branched-chain amino acid transport system permease protein
MNLASPRSVNLQLLIGGIVVAIYALGFGTGYTQRVLSVAGIYALMAIGYQFIFGYAGAIALSQGAFMGLGAYVSGILSVRYGIGFDASLPFSLGLPLLVAFIVAVPVLRLQTHYFALATLIISQIILLIAIQWVDMTGGANGIGGIHPLSLLGWNVPPGQATLILIWSVVALGAAAAWQFGRGSLGQAYALMRVNSVAAASIGIDTARLRLIAFLLSSAYAGLAGAFYVHAIRVISPDVLELPVMVTCLTIAVVGGRTRTAGIVTAAVLIIELPEWFRFMQKYYLIAYGAILLLVVIAAPEGLVEAWQRILTRLRPARVAAPSRIAPIAVSWGHAAGRGDVAESPLLSLTEIRRHFGGVRALDGVSFDVAAGEILGLIGPNGSGKTTLVNIVSGIYRPDAGRVRFGGADITSLSPYEIARLGIARTFQTVALVDAMSALDNVAVARGSGRLSLRQTFSVGIDDAHLARRRGEAMGFLDLMGVADDAARPCGALAYGLRRRVEVARALATEPRLLLLDEPATGLNQSEQEDFARRMAAIVRARCTLLVIEHNIPFLNAFVDRLVCLDYGRVIAQGDVASVQRDARVIEAYLGRGVVP